MATTDTRLIGLDWGTSSLRACRIGVDGAVIESRRSDRGIVHIEPGDFDATLGSAVGDWLEEYPGAALIASGMVGSRQGWFEAPYVECPADATGLARSIPEFRTAPGRALHIVPGVCCLDADGVPDVIRGEETQIVGAVDDPARDAVLILPGTHSKWVHWRGGRIESFRTYMTGEVFAALAEHTILARLMSGTAFDAAAFERGVAYAAGARGSLLAHLFSARTLGLFEQIPPGAIHAYLSGLLIGHEIDDALARAGDAPLVVIGDDRLVDRYRTALTARGATAEPGPAHAAARGQWRIATAAGLLDD